VGGSAWPPPASGSQAAVVLRDHGLVLSRTPQPAGTDQERVRPGTAATWAPGRLSADPRYARGTALPTLPFADAMAPAIAYVTFDCEEPDALATFWAAATGLRKESSPDPRT
jgi:hypothetical protein